MERLDCVAAVLTNISLDLTTPSNRRIVFEQGVTVNNCSLTLKSGNNGKDTIQFIDLASVSCESICRKESDDIFLTRIICGLGTLITPFNPLLTFNQLTFDTSMSFSGKLQVTRLSSGGSRVVFTILDRMFVLFCFCIV
jgi:hypothetical protein